MPAPTPSIRRAPAIGSPWVTRAVTRLDAQTSDNVHITGGYVDPTVISRVHSPLTFEGTFDESADQSAAINDMTSAARATADAATNSYRGWMTFAGGRHRVETTINATVFRSRQGAGLSEGILIGHTTGEPVLDITGSRSFAIQNLYIWGDAVDTPSCGLLMQRYSTGGSAGPAASDHYIQNLTARGSFTFAAICCYACETSELISVWGENDSRNIDAYAVVLTGQEEVIRLRVPNSALQPNVSGSRSFIHFTASGLQAFRINNPSVAITGITQANPGVVTYSGADTLVDGDVVVIDDIRAGMEEANGVYTVTNLNTTANTFELGVDTTGFTAYTTGGGVYYRTGPAVYVSRSSFLKLENLYVVTYGSYHVVCDRTDGFGDEGLDISMHGEGMALALVQFKCNNGTYDMKRFKFRESSNHAITSVFSVVSGGAFGVLKMLNPDILINRFNTALHGSGKLFDHPEVVEIHYGRIHLAEGKYHNMPNEFLHFTGVLSADDWDREIFVGERTYSYDHYLVADFLKVASDDSQFTTTLGSSATATVTYPVSNSGGTVLLTAGSTNAGMAGDGVQLVGNQVWAANNGGLVIGFDASISTSTSFVAFVGFSDTAALEMPCTGGAGDVITGVADDFCGMFFDSAMDTATWWFVGRKVAGTVQKFNTTIVPAIASGEFNRWRIAFNAVGSATLYRNDGAVSLATLTGAMKATNMFGPYMAAFPRAGSAGRILRLARIQVYGKQGITLV